MFRFSVSSSRPLSTIAPSQSPSATPHRTPPNTSTPRRASANPAATPRAPRYTASPWNAPSSAHPWRRYSSSSPHGPCCFRCWRGSVELGRGLFAWRHFAARRILHEAGIRSEERRFYVWNVRVLSSVRSRNGPTACSDRGREIRLVAHAVKGFGNRRLQIQLLASHSSHYCYHTNFNHKLGSSPQCPG